MHIYSVPKLESLIGVKISQYCSVDMNEAGAEKKILWMHGVVKRVGDSTWLDTQMPGQTARSRARRQRLTGTHVKRQTT